MAFNTAITIWLLVSVTAIDWRPEVISETENVCTPASAAVNV